MKTIVALIDFSDLTPIILEQTQKLAKVFSSNVVLLHGVPKHVEAVDIGIASPVVAREATAEEWAAHKARLLELTDPLKKAGINVTAAQCADMAAENILAESRWLQADLIVMGTHHHGMLHDLVMGNLTREILQHAFCPVLVVPAALPAVQPASDAQVQSALANPNVAVVV
jgi:nucleotide-binding universal stress UspA family protein